MSGAVFAAFYRIVRCIPAGKVGTYGQMDPTVPCHRVVDRFGGTKACFDTFAPGTQRTLLEMEGVVFTLEGRVDLERCQWEP